MGSPQGQGCQSGRPSSSSRQCPEQGQERQAAPDACAGQQQHCCKSRRLQLAAGPAVQLLQVASLCGGVCEGQQGGQPGEQGTAVRALAATSCCGGRCLRKPVAWLACRPVPILPAVGLCSPPAGLMASSCLLLPCHTWCRGHHFFTAATATAAVATATTIAAAAAAAVAAARTNIVSRPCRAWQWLGRCRLHGFRRSCRAGRHDCGSSVCRRTGRACSAKRGPLSAPAQTARRAGMPQPSGAASALCPGSLEPQGHHACKAQRVHSAPVLRGAPAAVLPPALSARDCFSARCIATLMGTICCTNESMTCGGGGGGAVQQGGPG